MKQLGIKPKVKYISEQKQIKFDFEKAHSTEDEKLLDWGKSLLRKNIQKSKLFNFEKDPLVLTPE
jgi:hypothetical protein